MRISDWSSDVCSSDLSATTSTSAKRGTSPCAAATSMVPRSEIGRASCRERVCQLRVDLGGRRIIKKKRRKQTTCSTNTSEQASKTLYTKEPTGEHRPTHRLSNNKNTSTTNTES